MTPDAAGALYRSTLDEMADLRDGTDHPEQWNRLVNSNHDAYLALRDSDDGRRVIEDPMSHESPTVRGWSAAHVLLWNPDAARPVLTALAGEGGLAGLSAKTTLSEFDSGQLSHDW